MNMILESMSTTGTSCLPYSLFYILLCKH